MKAAPKSQRAMYDEASRKLAEIHETFLEMLPTMRRKDLERLVDKRPALWGRFASYLTSGHVFVDDPPAGTRHHSTKKSPTQLQREIDEVLASPGSFSYEEAMAALEKKHAGVKRGGSLRAGHAPVVPKKEIIGFEFQIERDGQRYWTRLQGSGGQLGAGSLHAVRDLGPKSERVKALCAKLMRAAREELRRAGTIRVYQDREDPGQRIRAVPASAIRACRPIVA